MKKARRKVNHTGVLEGLLPIGVLAVAGLIPLVYSPFGAQHYTLPKLLALSLGLTVLLIITAFGLFFEDARVRLGGALGYLAFSFFALAVLSFFFSLDKTSGWFGHYPRHDGLIFYLLLAAWFFVVLQVDWSGRNHAILVRTVLITASVVSAIGLAQAAGLISFADQSAGGRISATLGNAIFLSCFLGAAFTILLASILTEKPPADRRLMYVVGLLLVSALVLTASRSGVLAATVGGVLVVWRQARRSPRYALGVAGAAVALLLALTASQVFTGDPRGEDLPAAFTSERLELAKDARLVYARAAVSVIAARPLLGAGPSNFPWAAQSYQGRASVRVEGADWRFDDAHNYWLQIAASLGLPALAVFVLIVGKFLADGAALARTDEKYWGIAAAAAAILVGISFEPLAVTNSVYLWLFIGVTASLRSQTKSFRPAAGAAVALMAVALTGFVFLARMTAADHSFGAALTVAAGNPDAARGYYEQAVERAPWVDAYHGRLGKAWLREARETGDGQAAAEGLGHLEKAAEAGALDPQNWIPLALANQQASEIFGLDRRPAAVDAAERALKLAPEMPAAHRAMAAVLVSQGRAGEALKYAREAVDIDPRYEEGRLWLGYVYEKLERRPEALAAYGMINGEPWSATAGARAQKLRQ